MTKKVNIEIDFNRDNFLIAISCHRKDYWIAYKINEVLKTDLKRTDDLPVFNDKLDELIHYPLYYYHDFDCEINYYLLINHNSKAKLFPSQKTTDFFLLINGPASDKFVQDKVKKIKGIPNVLMAYETALSKIKVIDNFLLDLELHMLEISKKMK
jgi:hypothetical protein